ncbi:YihA family ribosome biogenesis GTP-binding protein [Oleiharenicola lentus]|uniref:Probable GTP-binding protein EngB n=1 Tax=Oleiharenicola lentus TaxID=2508720 RepID=A0A4Q1C8Y9_9BACT|nr:ribosome biogenesis GTP-binding protein YihA/YsxC [Oleiharenicola lentus]RXK55336.1 YihA family ribosome biogenesis GTP-binding protein [Oleiharenicola lentus]
MKIKSAEFETSATGLANVPRLAQPEIALIGRSNVGKSSLLNLLAERRDLARVSDLPGKTRLMNFYSINRNWRLVDLPGYGYAKVSKSERADFNEAAADYIEGRKNLRAVLVLIDSRLEPQPIDLAFVEWLVETKVTFGVVFTKTDKQSVSQTQASVARFRAVALDGLDPAPAIFLSSAKTKAGRTEILRYIASRL